VLTEGLARFGHQVEVFTNCSRPGIIHGVRWRQREDISRAQRPEVMVSVWNETSVVISEVNIPHLFWMLDFRTAGAKEFLRAPGAPRREIIVASRAMRELLVGQLSATDPIEIPHPVPLGCYPRLARRLAALYCSVPDRGLDVALKLWPRIRQRIPEAELWVTSGYELWGYSPTEADRLARKVVKTERLPAGVKLWGVIRKAHLTRLQASASLMFYPCRAEELFCLSAAECAAAGLPIVTSHIGALSERVVDGVTGFLIEGDIESGEVQRAFVDRAVQLLSDPGLCRRMGEEGRKLTRSYSIDEVVPLWETAAGVARPSRYP